MELYGPLLIAIAIAGGSAPRALADRRHRRRISRRLVTYAQPWTRIEQRLAAIRSKLRIA